MKNKSLIGWGLYYSAAGSACGIYALLNTETIEISFLSLLPLGLAAIPLIVFSKWYVTNGFGRRTVSNPTFDLKYQKDHCDIFLCSSDDAKRRKKAYRRRTAAFEGTTATRGAWVVEMKS